MSADALSTYLSKLDSARKNIVELEELQPKIERLNRVAQIMARFTEMRFMLLEKTMIVCVKVNKIADIEPVLETIQDALGIEFDNTHDAAEFSWRTYECKDAKWLRVDAELRADGPECKRVIVGYEQKPVYELRCGEDQQSEGGAAADEAWGAP